MAGKVLVVEFRLAENRFVGINAGSEFTFNESISFEVSCKDPGRNRLFLGKAIGRT